MTATALNSEKLEGATLDELRKRKVKLSDEYERVKAQKASCLQQSEALKGERKTLVTSVLAFRSQTDATAQNRVRAIRKELEALEQDAADHETASAYLAQLIAGVEREIERAEWEERRAGLRDLIEERLRRKVSADLVRKAAALATALQAASDEDDQIAGQLIDFEPQLRGARDSLQGLKRVREEIIGFSLRKALPIETRGMTEWRMENRNIAESEERAYAAALECLDRLELVF